jgi:uncharacterized membrane protein YphA (DoxX/SURF4 family)
MLSIFPSLFTYEQVGPFLIRIVLGLTLAHFGYRKIVGKGQSEGSNTRTYGIVEMSIALFLIIGLYTQLAALLNVVILVIKLGHKVKKGLFLSDGVNYYVLLLVMALSLLFTGPGCFAFDRFL